MSYVGTVVRGIKAPIIKRGDNLVDIVFDSIVSASENEGFKIENKDVVCITEAIVARAQNNYANVNQIAKDIKNKFDGETVGLILPILSRNRFSMLLKGISMGCKKLVIQLSYPGDEVGNKLVSIDELDKYGINPYSDSFTETQFRKYFPNTVHTFTGVDYINFYKEIAGNNTEVVLSNNPRFILEYTDQVLVANIHERFRTKKILVEAGARKVYTLDEVLSQSVDNSGYHPTYGVLGSNIATEDSVKLFPRDSQYLVDEIQKKFMDKYNKTVEVMIYGDGAFKDPVGGIWELADPVVSPFFTKGLVGTPNEIKLKYMADTKIKDLSGEAAQEAMKKIILEKKNNLVGVDDSLGTTPRRLTDLLGSLADLTSGSGDKGTPIVFIKGYFDNYAS
ncbi:MAG: coenzyme F420-0:L-glutamate ligase [Bacilli bacterium]|nr:coenzyme F420-0:L-glutamate ligase [Bacilli bacterium]